MTWTVVRFPNGSWSTGGKPTDPDYAACEVWQIEANSRAEATRKAQAKRSQAKRKERSQASPTASTSGMGGEHE
jgi:hypothetical protein